MKEILFIVLAIVLLTISAFTQTEIELLKKEYGTPTEVANDYIMYQYSTSEPPYVAQIYIYHNIKNEISRIGVIENTGLAIKRLEKALDRPIQQKDDAVYFKGNVLYRFVSKGDISYILIEYLAQ